MLIIGSLSVNQIQTLSSSGIPIVEYVTMLNNPHRIVSGIALSEEAEDFCNTVLSLLSITQEDIDSAAVPTMEPDVRYLDVNILPQYIATYPGPTEQEEQNMPPAKVTIKYMPGNNYIITRVRRILQPLVTKFCKKTNRTSVTIRDQKGVARQPFIRGEFHILIECSDVHGSISYDGVPSMKACQDPTSIYVNHDQFCLASLVGDKTLYIHPQLEQMTPKVLTRTLRTIFDGLPQEAEAPVANIDPLQKYIDLAVNRTKKELKSLNKEIETEILKQETLMSQIAKSIRKIPILESKRAAIESDNAVNTMANKIREEFEKLKSNEKVESVDIIDTKIIVNTKTIYCYHPRTGNQHKLGKFQISIDCSLKTPGSMLKWKNTTNSVKRGSIRLDAPHIRDGVACLGNLAQMLPSLIAGYEFPVIIGYAIKFLETVNLNDRWGQDIDLWPVVTKGG